MDATHLDPLLAIEVTDAITSIEGLYYLLSVDNEIHIFAEV